LVREDTNQGKEVSTIFFKEKGIAFCYYAEGFLMRIPKRRKKA
jgi:hypothetical protein